MNALTLEKKVAIVAALVEGISIRSIERLLGVHRDTIMRLLVSVGDKCAALLDSKLRRIHSQRVQVDEIWTFVFVKQARLTEDHNHAEMGDQYVFVGIDADTKLAISHLIGKRDAATAYYFMRELKERLANRVQLTTDGFKPYLNAVEDNFGADIDYAQLVKMYGQAEGADGSRAWYTPVIVTAALPVRITGNPVLKHVSTSYSERQNLTMLMQMRRFTRLTNAFSKKLANLKAAVALYFCLTCPRFLYQS